MGSPGRFTEQGVQRVRSFAMHGRSSVGVEVERDRHGGVAEHLRDELRVDALAEHERRRGVQREQFTLTQPRRSGWRRRAATLAALREGDNRRLGPRRGLTHHMGPHCDERATAA
jgi:hypothetical protein